MRAVTSDQMREIDRIAIEEYGISGLTLMENAGAAVAVAAEEILSRSHGPVAIFCGKGNNGGDGFVAARRLFDAGYSVNLFLSSEPEDICKDAGEKLRGLADRDIRLMKPDEEAGSAGKTGYSVVIDALLGTGFSGVVKPPLSRMIEYINAMESPVIAVDIPSGMNGTTGEAGDVFVKADITVTFGLMKTGFLKAGAEAVTGEVRVVDIGFPKELLEG